MRKGMDDSVSIIHIQQSRKEIEDRRDEKYEWCVRTENVRDNCLTTRQQ